LIDRDEYRVMFAVYDICDTCVGTVDNHGNRDFRQMP